MASDEMVPRIPVLRFPVDLICYDFDGVMTDNRVLVIEDGVEAVFVNRGDGLAISMFKKEGLRQVILSTEANPVVSVRAAKLDLPVLQGIRDKAAELMSYVETHGIDLAATLYVGNDINDLSAMLLVGHRVAPADAHPSILRIAEYVTRACGGAGVIRELYDFMHVSCT